MKKRRVFKLLLKFVKNFLRNWHIMITINYYMMMKCSVNINILQNFLLSSILYLFYNMNLLKTCDNIKLRISFTDFINDINILIYEKFMKHNCKVLREIYDRCKQWSKMYNIKFSKTKHELIHFMKISKWFNMNVDVKLMKHQINLKSDIRVLRVQLNFKLRWATYMHHVEAKLVIKQKIMQTIIESTWDSSMTTKKQIYFAMTRSLLSHEVIIWYMSQRMKNHWKDLNVKLKSVQERALWQIINVYRVISTKTLQIEINTASIDIHLRKLIQLSIMNINFQKSDEVIEIIMHWIRNDLILKKSWKSKLHKTSLQLKQKWMKETLKQMKMKWSHLYMMIFWSKSSRIVIVASKKISIS